MHALGRRISGHLQLNMLAPGILDGIGIVNRPDFLLGRIDENRLLPASKTFLGAKVAAAIRFMCKFSSVEGLSELFSQNES